ncbi:MAG: DUF924 domain-containing protein [Gammaproteobacteria bacterium]|nr:DUF924 domain-containing protein [Gammaproteobacteria bacterium]
MEIKPAEESIKAKGRKVIEFWLGKAESDPAEAGRKNKIWYGNNPEVDRKIKEDFGELFDLAVSGNLDSWSHQPYPGLALIILLDQFTRNTYRGTPLAFSNDKKALEIARQMTKLKLDQKLSTVGRAFLYHPFEHSENLKDQDDSVSLFSALVTESKGEWKKLAQGFLDYAVQHRDIIRQFGRFPHRNAILRRISSPAEMDFLNRDRRSWGQQAKK